MIWPNTILDCICFFFLTLKNPCKMQLETKIGYLVNFDILKSNQNPTLIIFGNLGFFPLKWSAILKSRRYYNPIHFQMLKAGCHNYIPIPSKFACKYSISKLYILVSYYQYSDISFCNNFDMFGNINLHYSRYYKTFFVQKKSTKKHSLALSHPAFLPILLLITTYNGNPNNCFCPVFAQECKVTYEQNSISHVRYITFLYPPIHTQMTATTSGTS